MKYCVTNDSIKHEYQLRVKNVNLTLGDKSEINQHYTLYKSIIKLCLYPMITWYRNKQTRVVIFITKSSEWKFCFDYGILWENVGVLCLMLVLVLGLDQASNDVLQLLHRSQLLREKWNVVGVKKENWNNRTVLVYSTCTSTKESKYLSCMI